MNRNWIAVAFGSLFFVIAFFIMLDQYLLIGIWFQPEDIHHETFVLSAVAIGIGIFLGAITKGNGANAKDKSCAPF